MTDIQGLRAQLRDTRPAPRSSSGGSIPFWAIAAGAAVLGFAIVLITPRFYTMQRTAALPGVAAANRAVPSDSAPAPAATPEPAANAARYAGKTPEEIVRTVDALCDERARVLRGASPARPPAAAAERSKAQVTQVADDPANGPRITAADEKLYCFLTEAPARFCAPNLKRKATAEIINYFKDIEYANRKISDAARLQGVKPDASRPVNGAQDLGPQDLPATMPGRATIDPRVIEAIEGLMRASYLAKAHRDDIAANVPHEIKDRFARVVSIKAACPKPPWWWAWL